MIRWNLSVKNPVHEADFKKWVGELALEQSDTNDIVYAPYLCLAQSEAVRTYNYMLTLIEKVEKDPVPASIVQVSAYKKYEQDYIRNQWRGNLSSFVKNSIKYYNIEKLFPAHFSVEDEEEPGLLKAFRIANFAQDFLGKMSTENTFFHKSKGYIFINNEAAAKSVVDFYRNQMEGLRNIANTYSYTKYHSVEEVNAKIRETAVKFNQLIQKILLEILNIKRPDLFRKRDIKLLLYSSKKYGKYFGAQYATSVDDIVQSIINGESSHEVEPGTTQPYTEDSMGISVAALSHLIDGSTIVSNIVASANVCIERVSGYRISNTGEAVNDYKSAMKNKADRAELHFNKILLELRKKWPNL